MILVTLAEAKDRLSLDFDYKDKEIESRVNSIEGYLTIATGLDLAELRAVLNSDKSPESETSPEKQPLDERSAEEPEALLLASAHDAKEYILFKLYLDYYNAHTELDDRRLSSIIVQLQTVALVTRYAE